MKKIGIFIILLAFVMAGCAATQPAVLQGAANLQALTEQIQTLNEASIETKRAAAIAILDNWSFDGGYWAVVFEASRIRPTAELQQVMYELTQLSLKYKNEELSDHDLGRVAGYYTIYILAGIVRHGAQEIVPQITQFLALF